MGAHELRSRATTAPAPTSASAEPGRHAASATGRHARRLERNIPRSGSAADRDWRRPHRASRSRDKIPPCLQERHILIVRSFRALSCRGSQISPSVAAAKPKNPRSCEATGYDNFDEVGGLDLVTIDKPDHINRQSGPAEGDQHFDRAGPLSLSQPLASIEFGLTASLLPFRKFGIGPAHDLVAQTIDLAAVRVRRLL